MKKSELLFGAVLVPLDMLALLAAAAAAYFVRVSPTVQQIRPAVFQPQLPFVTYMQLAIIVAAIIIGISALQGSYAMQSTRRPIEEVTRIFTSISFGFLLIIVYAFLSAEVFQSRFILLTGYVFALFFVVAGRYLIRRLQRYYLRQGYGVHRVALVGNSRYSNQLEILFERRPQLGYKTIGSLAQVRWRSLKELHEKKGIDLIVQTDPTMPIEDNTVLLDFAEQYKIDYAYIPNMFEAHAAHVQYRHLGGVPMMQLQRTPLEGWGRVVKRGMDIFGAVFGLVLLAPVFISAAIAIKLDSAGPVFYRQVRIGRNKEPFEIIKFRSMFLDYSLGDKYGGEKAKAYEKKLRQQTNERTGPLFKMRHDPRITRVGRFIRRWRIDELPQFFNVIKGEMSLLGPRPHLPEEVSRYDKHQSKLFTIKPGMSGMAQVNGSAGLSFDQEASLDIGYIEGWSLRLDIILLLKTFAILVTDKNAV